MLFCDYQHVAPPRPPAEGDERGKKSKKKVAIPKDRHAPKKPITAYNLYAADERIRVRERERERGRETSHTHRQTDQLFCLEMRHRKTEHA